VTLATTRLASGLRAVRSFVSWLVALVAVPVSQLGIASARRAVSNGMTGLAATMTGAELAGRGLMAGLLAHVTVTVLQSWIGVGARGRRPVLRALPLLVTHLAATVAGGVCAVGSLVPDLLADVAAQGSQRGVLISGVLIPHVLALLLVAGGDSHLRGVIRGARIGGVARSRPGRRRVVFLGEGIFSNFHLEGGGADSKTIHCHDLTTNRSGGYIEECKAASFGNLQTT